MCDSDTLETCSWAECWSNGFHWYTGRCWLIPSIYTQKRYVEKSYFDSLDGDVLQREIAGHIFNVASILQHDTNLWLEWNNDRLSAIQSNTSNLSGDTGGGDTGGGDTSGPTEVDFTELIDYFKGGDFSGFNESGEAPNGAPEYTEDNDDSHHSLLRQVALYLKNISMAYGDAESVFSDGNLVEKITAPTPSVGASNSAVSALMNEYMEGVDYDGNGLVFGRDFHIIAGPGQEVPRFVEAFTDDEGNPLTTGTPYTYQEYLISKYIEPLRQEAIHQKDTDGNGKVFTRDFNFSSGCPSQLSYYNKSYGNNPISFSEYLQSVGAPSV